MTDGDGRRRSRAKAPRSSPPTSRNLAVRAYALLADPAGKHFRFVNRIPLERGLGSSAAAIALGLVAAAPHASAEELLAAGLTLEPHADNLAAALLGGLTLAWDGRIARIAERLPLDAVAVIPQRAHLDRELARNASRNGPARRGGRERGPRGAARGGRRERRRRAVRRRARRLAARALPALRRCSTRSARRRRAGCAGATLSGSGPTVIAWAVGRGRLRGRPRERVPRPRGSRARQSPRGERCERRARRRSAAAGLRGGPHSRRRPPRPRARPLGDRPRSGGRRAPSAADVEQLERSLRARRHRADGLRARPRRRHRAGPRAAGGCCATSATTPPARSTSAATSARCRRTTVEPDADRVPARDRATDDTITAEEILARLGDPALAAPRRTQPRALARRRGAARPGRRPDPRSASTPPSTEPLPAGRRSQPSSSPTAAPGVTACVVAQRLVLAGRDDVRLYPGSFSEWCRRESYPIEKGTP